MRSLFLFVAATSVLSPSALAFAPKPRIASSGATGRRACSTPTPPRAININLAPRHDRQERPRRIQNAIGAHYTPTRSSLHAASDDEQGDADADAEKSARDRIFWAKQRAFAAQLSSGADADDKRLARDKFAKRRQALTADTFYFSVLLAAGLWLVAPDPFVTASYLFGASAGTAYSFGLGKYVETIGGTIDDVSGEGAGGAGVGQARFAFLILLIVFLGKFRAQGLQEIPSILGFFTYQLASLGQGLREIDD